MRGQSKVVPPEKLRFSKLSHCFPIDSALCSLAEPQTQERALSGSNYCTTQPKWQMNKCHNTTACSLPLCANSLTHTHTHMHAHPLKPPKTPFSFSLSHVNTKIHTKFYCRKSIAQIGRNGCDRCTHTSLGRQTKTHQERNEGGLRELDSLSESRQPCP